MRHGFCVICNELTSSYTRKYCSKACLSVGMRPEWYDSWIDGVYNPGVLNRVHRGGSPVRLRGDLIALRGARCEECGWDKLNPVTGLSPLEMDHIDGDPTNNFISNLKLLCPNCHSLTPTYRYLNTPSSKAKRQTKPTQS